MRKRVKGANPYMPLWEHVPDGEPRVFEYNGEKRVYLYGSHDTMKTEYCGPDQVVWSAPVEDLTNWTCHGVCYTASDGGMLYAPDVVQKGDTFYMYVAEARGSRILVAKSKNPAGPFTDAVPTELGFDPGILVDDDGRVYAYWGFCGCACAELNDDMATIKPGTLHQNPMGHAKTEWNPDLEYVDFEDGFFEASSPRKINGKYVYIYSKRYNTPVESLGVSGDCNGFLSYKYSDKPLEDFQPGGDISFNGGEIIQLEDGSHHMTYQWGNNHGSLMEVNGQWYIFYHRQTGLNEYSRQAMIEPVDVVLGEDGHLYIGKIQYEERNGKKVPVSSGVVEMTSQGAQVNGLDAYSIISAGYACHTYNKAAVFEPGTTDKPYIKPVYEQTEETSSPVVNITNGTTVGFRYLQFAGQEKDPKRQAKKVTFVGEAKEDLQILVRKTAYTGEIIASMTLTKGETVKTVDVTGEVKGKEAIYFEFLSESKGEIAQFSEFYFD